MNSDFFTYSFWVVFVIVLGNFVYRVWKNRGLRAAIFSSPIVRTVGTLDLRKSGPMTTTLKIHCLESKGLGTPTVGIELVYRTALSYQMRPITLTSDQAFALRELLSQAVAESQGSYHEQAISLATR